MKQINENMKSYIQERYVYERIVKEIKDYKNCDCSMNENKEFISEGITDIVRKYAKMGLLTAGVIAALLSSAQVNAQDLESNISDKTELKKGVELADKKLKGIENQFLRSLKSQRKEGVLDDYNKLSPIDKVQALSFINKELKSGKSLKDVNIRFKTITNPTGSENILSKDTIQSTQFVADTSFVLSASNFKSMFQKNDWELSDSAKVELQNLFNNFLVIQKITIKVSSSTIRNTGKANNMTWLELSSKRGEAIKNEILNIGSYDCSGCGAEKREINENIIELDVNGDNGDGTSGPPSPFEKNPKSIERYDEMGIDQKFWKSKATGEPLENVNDYDQFQKAIVFVQGYVIDDEQKEVIKLFPTAKTIEISPKNKITKFKFKNRKVKKTKITSCPQHNL